MSGLDFSELKKISQDDNSAVFHHPDGHEIKISLSKLDDEEKKKLADMPVHKAEGEEVEPSGETPKVQMVSDAIPPAGKPGVPDMDNKSPAPAEDEEADDEDQAQEQPQAAAPVQTPPPPIPPALTPQQEAQQKTAHDLQFADDLKYGQINPKTYQDLYADKSLLGKTGTLFGLVLSGAGSGLTHQPNALLGMMDKQIERDVDAQKMNQSNKLNWYNASLMHDRMLPENAYKWAEASKAASDADFQKWRNVQAGISDMSATNDAANRATIGMVNDFQNTINKMPAGPQKDQAQKMQDGVVVPYFLNRVNQRNTDTAVKKTNANAMNPIPMSKPNPPPKGVAKSGQKYDAVNQARMNAMIQKGKFVPEAPDALDPNTALMAKQEAQTLAVNRNNAADWDDSFNKLASLPHAGQVPAAGAMGDVAASVGALGGGMSGGLGLGAMAAGVGKMLGGGAGKAIQDYFERARSVQVNSLMSRLGVDQATANSMLPSWADKDNPEALAEVHRKALQFFQSNKAEEAPTLKDKGLLYPFPNYQFSPPKQKSAEVSKPQAEETPAPSAPKKSLFQSLMPKGLYQQ